MLPLLGLALLAFAVAPKGRLKRIGLGDAEIVPRGTIFPTEVQNSTSIFLVRPQDFVHPSRRDEAARRGVESGSTWAVVPANGWAGAKSFPTSRAARHALTAAGFKGPVGRGQSSRWTR